MLTFNVAVSGINKSKPIYECIVSLRATCPKYTAPKSDLPVTPFSVFHLMPMPSIFKTYFLLLSKPSSSTMGWNNSMSSSQYFCT